MSLNRVIAALLTINLALAAVIIVFPRSSGPRVSASNPAKPAPSNPTMEMQHKLDAISLENAALDRTLNETREKVDAAARTMAKARRRTWPPAIVAENVAYALGRADAVRIGLDYLKAREAPKYAVILSQCELSDVQLSRLMDVLADRAASDMDFAAQGNTPSAANRAERDRRNAELRDKLSPIVGKDVAAALVEAEKRTASQAIIQQIADDMLYAATELDESQRRLLMAQWRAVSVARPTTEAEVDAAAASMADRNREVLSKAATILSPVQLTALSNFLARDIASQRAKLLGEVLPQARP